MWLTYAIKIATRTNEMAIKFTCVCRVWRLLSLKEIKYAPKVEGGRVFHCGLVYCIPLSLDSRPC